MDELFDIPVIYNGKELIFKAVLSRYGYTHKIKVAINGLAFIFEYDEEGGYRTIGNEIDNSNVNRELVKLVAEVLENSRSI